MAAYCVCVCVMSSMRVGERKKNRSFFLTVTLLFTFDVL